MRVAKTGVRTAAALLLTALLAASAAAQGHLVIIGGGGRPAPIMETFVELAGGGGGRVVVVPYASGDPAGTAEYQVEQIRETGAGEAVAAPADSNLIDSPEALALFDGATGVFFSGGDQRRLSRLLLGTEMLGRIRDIYERGGVVGGTSAGAAVMSERMITGDERHPAEDEDPFATIETGNIITTPGFGFVTEAVIDQHFIARKRLNRLISVTLEGPEHLGIGIDEATAIVVAPDRTFEVIGESGVLIFDARGAEIVPGEGRRLAFKGMATHLLLSGDRFDLIERTVRIAE